MKSHLITIPPTVDTLAFSEKLPLSATRLHLENMNRMKKAVATAITIGSTIPGDSTSLVLPAQRSIISRVAVCQRKNTRTARLPQWAITTTTKSPEHDEKFLARFYTGYHLNAMGYELMGKMICPYMDFIIRHNWKDFTKAGFIGTPFDYV